MEGKSDILPNTSQPRLLSFTLDGWTVLGGQVSVSLVDGVGVLVGRNGAGKSAILEGMTAISSWATGRTSRVRLFDSDSIPNILNIEIVTPTERRLIYRYEVISLPNSTEDPDIDDSMSDSSEESQFSWNEHCQYVDGDKELLWTTDTGVTTFSNGGDPITTILGNTNSLRQLHLPKNSRLKLPEEMQWVYAVLRGVRLLGKVPVRQTFRRRPSLLKVYSKGVPYSSFGLADSLARKILRRIDTGELHELESVCQRIGLGSKITVQKFVLSEEPTEKMEGEGEEYVSSVLLDGVNIGLLSDGTLRVLSILIEIIASHPSATTIIEEPETQIHPGMLAKLLNEIEAYTFEENLILSTHSPQVVAWTKPERINLVYRNHGRTTVRKLQEEEIQKVVGYLCEEGDLGDLLYSGILDE
ncbi:MAG: AAA family ATPase [Scytonema sp. PMC 1069.18]|nr:AAA family ATPase [Scytonema sp. PMC 1069.18]MEC4881245.1 AAA family ATPase [Scytonema sp. PMC 1070.18]